MKKKKLLSTVLALSAVLAMAGCGSSSSASQTGNYKNAGAAEGQAADAYGQEDYGTTEFATEEAAADTDASGAVGNGTTATPIQSQRKLTKDVSIYARTENFDDTVAAIEKAVKDAGGYISSSQLSTGYGTYNDQRSKSYEIEIPADQLDSFLSQADGLMNIYDQSEQVTDITDTYNEAQSELDSLKIEEDSLNEMLKEAKKVEDTIQIQDRLAYIHMRQNELTNMLNGYDKEIAYSTVNLSLDEVSVEEENSNTVWDRISYGFKSSLHAVGSFFVDLFVFILSASPVLVILAAIIILIVVLVKRGNKKKAARKAKVLQNVPLPPRGPQNMQMTQQAPPDPQNGQTAQQEPQEEAGSKQKKN